MSDLDPTAASRRSWAVGALRVGVLLVGMSTGCIDRHGAPAADPGDAAIAPPACASDDACDDGNPCTDDRCEPTYGCIFQPHLRACDDGDACTVGERCRAGACRGGAPLDCDDGDLCTADACDAERGCVSQALPEGVWVDEPVDTLGDVGQHSDLVIDRDGTAHVAYRDASMRIARYAHRPPGGRWSSAPVDAPVALYLVIALGTQGRIHVAGVDRDDAALHATTDGGPWVVSRREAVSEGAVGLAVAPSGRALLAYSREDTRRLKLIGLDPDTGEIEAEADPPIPLRVGRIGMRVDADRRQLYLLFNVVGMPDEAGVHLAMRSLDGGPWQIEQVTPAPAWLVGGPRVDPNGRVHIVYRDDETLYHAVRAPGGGWTIDAPLGAVELADVALGLDRKGRPVIAWAERYGLTLNVLMADDEGRWLPEEVIRNPEPQRALSGTPSSVSVAFDPVGETWHLTWYDPLEQDLRHAWRCR